MRVKIICYKMKTFNHFLFGASNLCKYIFSKLFILLVESLLLSRDPDLDFLLPFGDFSID